MILTCPQCNARYLLPAQTLAPEGRRVKCSSCGEIWRETPDSAEIGASAAQSPEVLDHAAVPADSAPAPVEDIPEGVKPMPESPPPRENRFGKSQKPPPPKPNSFGGYAAAACLFIVCSIALTGMRDMIGAKWPPSVAVFEMMGLEVRLPVQDISFDSVRTQARPARGGEVVSISGKIINRSRQPVTPPLIEASAPADSPVARWNIAMPERPIAPGESAEFSSEYLGPATDAKDVRLRFALEAPKTDEEDDENTQVPDEGDPAHPNASEEDEESPEPSSSASHPESSH